jgi:predicted secreted protein
LLARAAHATDNVNDAATVASNKKILSDAELKAIILSDIIDRQFLVTGHLTLSAYEPTATWQDEIDTYAIQKWVTGTEKLFVGEQSSVRLVGDIVVTPTQAEFRFDEDLTFRLPLGVRPVVHLTGRVVLERNVATGRVQFGREIWDQDVSTVLKSAKF